MKLIQSKLLALMSVDELYYIYTRIFAVVTLLAFSILLPAELVGSRTGLIVTTAVSVVVTVYMLLAASRGRVKDAMIEVLVPDVVSLGVLTYVFDFTDDAFFPIVLGVALLYALVRTRREAFLVSAAIAAAYLAGQFYARTGSALDQTFTLLKALSLVVSTMLLGSAVERRRIGERTAGEASERAERANAELEERVRELKMVSRVSEAVHASLELDVMGPAVLHIISDNFGLSASSLFVIDKSSGEALMSADWGFERPEEESACACTSSTEIDVPAGQGGEEAFACLSVFESASTSVVLCAGQQELDTLTDHDRGTLATISSELVVAVDNSRLYRLTQSLAITDELTGLPNYRFLQRRLEQEIGRARRFGGYVSFIMFDVDDFKAFNDTQGHVAGDVVLGEIGRVARSAVRDVDMVARYGGEEFSIILPETDAQGAYIVAEKLRERIGRTQFSDAAGAPSCQLTVSIGLATFPTHAWDKESLLREADNALYHAKNGGKNRVRTPAKASLADLAGAIPSAASRGVDR